MNLVAFRTLVVFFAAIPGICSAAEGTASDTVIAAQKARIAVIDRVAPSVVAIFDDKERGGGSGVIIDAQGFGLSNFHVLAPMLESMRGWGGLPDGRKYELQVLGIDPTGDLAMFRLAGDDAFPFAALGDSELVSIGDIAIAMGNPFSMSEDNSPTVTLGLVTGVHRYQWGTGGNLSYTDCIQTDASINPGNSGGPLFNENGEIIGINGRISVNTRGRFNVGFGYAISSNQVKRFIPALRAGLLARHGSLPPIRESGSSVIFGNVPVDSRAFKAGLRPGERLVGFEEMAIANRNQYASVLGAYPHHWSVILDVERDEKIHRLALRLETLNTKLGKPFVPRRETNLDEVRRVIEGFVRNALGQIKLPSTIKWNVEREYFADPTGDCKPSENFVVAVDEKVMTRRRPGQDEAETLVTISDGGIVEQALHLQSAERLAAGALYFLYTQLLPQKEAMFESAVFVGGDALIPLDLDAARPAASSLGKTPAQRRVLNVIEFPINDATVAHFMFDYDTARLARARIRDIPTGDEITMDFGKFEQQGGMLFPTTIEVRGHGASYRDEYSVEQSP